MGKSLQDQLLNAGLIDKGQAKKAKVEKRKQVQQKRKNKVETVDNNKLQAQKALTEKNARDRELNLQRKKEADLKASIAQIRELIELNHVQQDKEGVAYNFNDDNKVKRIYIAESTRKLIIQGKLAIVKLNNKYEIVPTEVANKIHSRDENLVIVLNNPMQNDSVSDDPYADYQVPDDLMW